MHPELLDPVETESESPVERVVRKTPWWSISIGLHVLALLIVGIFWVVRAEEAPPVTRVLPKPPPVKPPDWTHPRIDKVPVPVPEEAPEVTVTHERDDVNSAQFPDDYQAPRGDDLFSDDPLKSTSSQAVIGGGATAGGAFGRPTGGGKIDGRGPGGATPQTQEAVLGALRWLARHQDPGGSWQVTDYTSRCTAACSPNPGHPEYDAGVTGLSLLAFLGAGYTHLSKDTHDGICFGDVVRKGLQWMMAHQDAEGCIGPRNTQKYMYNHAICALAITEAYGLTGSALFRDQAQRAVDFVVAAQNPGKGWRYRHRPGDNDSSVTGWAVMVLKSAELSGLSFPLSAYEGSISWYDGVTDGAYGRVGYTFRNSGKVFVPGLNEHFDHHEALTAIGVMSRIFIERKRNDPRIRDGCAQLTRDLPRWEGDAIDFYYWYYASLALFQYDGPDGATWSRWNEPMKNALVKNQNTRSTGCKDGSWEPVGRWCGEGGRVYATAINALTLEVYYRYPSVFGRH